MTETLNKLQVVHYKTGYRHLLVEPYEQYVACGYSFHADWFNGRRSDAKDQFTRNCVNTAFDCDSHMLGNGQSIC